MQNLLGRTPLARAYLINAAASARRTTHDSMNKLFQQFVPPAAPPFPNRDKPSPE
jgi:hypothetical protein